MNASRLGRTIVLGAVAAGLGIWWLGRAYDVETPQLLRFLLGSALFVLVAAVLALAAAPILRALRRRRPAATVGLGKPEAASNRRD